MFLFEKKTFFLSLFIPTMKRRIAREGKSPNLLNRTELDSGISLGVPNRRDATFQVIASRRMRKDNLDRIYLDGVLQ